MTKGLQFEGREVVALNLIVLRSTAPERAVRFYASLGLHFARERHGTGPDHWAADAGGVVLEIYPAADGITTVGVRLGFRVEDVAATTAALTAAGGVVVKPPRDGPWGPRGVVADPDGHRVALIAPPRGSSEPRPSGET